MVIVTDCAYRSAIAAIYSLQKLGEEIVAVTTEINANPPAFHSKFIKRKVVLPSDKNEYAKALLKLCGEYNRPVILPIGVFTLGIIAERRADFEKVADFCVASSEVLERLNDKKKSKKLALESGFKAPAKRGSFPLVIKPSCGEKFGLKASERYKIINNEKELNEALEVFSKYDNAPIVEEYIEGDGIGVSVVIGKDGVECSAFCHRRLSEYPASGGPSSTLVTFENDALVKKTVEMLKGAGFIGIAMVEFKARGDEFYFLEVNPRIWGSFGATYKAKSDFLAGYLAGARGLKYAFAPMYEIKKVKFLPNAFASVLSYLKAKRFCLAFKTLGDSINPFVPNAIFNIADPIPAILDLFRKRR